MSCLLAQARLRLTRVAEGDLELLIFLLPPHKPWDYRVCQNDQFFVLFCFAVLGVEPRALCALSKSSANSAQSLSPLQYLKRNEQFYVVTALSAWEGWKEVRIL